MTKVDRIAAALAEAHGNPPALVPANELAALSRDRAYEIQSKVLALLGQPASVIKVAIGADGLSLGAPIPAGLVFANGEHIAHKRPLEGIEIEVAVRLAEDLTPEIAKRGRGAVLQVIDSFLFGIELISSRIDNRNEAGPFGPLADFMVTGGYVIGDQALPEEPAAPGLPIVVRCNGEVISNGVAAYPFEDALTPIIAFASSRQPGSERLRKGIIITTGALNGLISLPEHGGITVSVGSYEAASFRLRT